MILSASWASSSRLVVLEVEARTLLGSCYKKSSRRKVLFVVLVRPMEEWCRIPIT